MAGVSFKVPKSPQKDILKIDEFLGVDLTNSGINMDERRSPNAINMVRNVPGKVRKRTGYKKEIQFRDPNEMDVNICRDGGKEKSVRIDYIYEWTKAFDLSTKIGGTDDGCITLFFSYQSEYPFEIGNYQINRRIQRTYHPGTSVVFDLTDYQEFDGIYIRSDYHQTITFYFMRVYGVNNKATCKYTEDPAERAADYVVDSEATDKTIYGCHEAKLTNKNELYHPDPAIINVNRIANSDPHIDVEFSLGDTSATFASLEEHIPEGVKFTIHFSYNMNVAYQGTAPSTAKRAKISICGNDFYIYENENSDVVSKTFYSKDFDTRDLVVSVDNMTGINSIRFTFFELTVMYEWDGTPLPYHETPASFDLSKLYTPDETNYVRSGIETSTNNPAVIGSYSYETPRVKYLAHVSFRYRFWVTNTSNETKTFTYTLQIRTAVNYHDVVWSKTYTKEVGPATSNTKPGYIDIDTSEEVYLSTGDDWIEDINWSHSSDSALTFHGITYSSIHLNKLISEYNYVESQKWYLYHVGNEFFIREGKTDKFTKAYTEANNHVSQAWQFEKNLYIIDGKEMYIYEVAQTSLSTISGDKAYIPTVTIAKEPSGGGQQYEALNMLQPAFYELFQGDGESVLFQLSFSELDGTAVKVWMLQQNAEWEEYEEGVNFIVDRVTGSVRFNSAPPVSPLTGEDNVKILAYRTVDGYRDRVTKCTLGTLFGVGGAEDRLFLSGNPDYPNWDFFSGQYDPTYFPDTGYSTLGSEQSAVVGYAVINNYLATFKDGYDSSQVVFIREGDLIVNEETKLSDPAFKLINTLQGNGVLSPYSFGYLQTEPVFLTKMGIYAITSQDITGEKYSQNRSFYLDGKLLKESGLENAVAVVFKDQYYLVINNRMYILDGMQATRTDRAEPYATRQYAGFLCDNIPAISIWTDGDNLCFGTSNGRVCQFYNDAEDPESYNDVGKAIYACWETPDLDGKLFYKNKTFRYFAVRIMRAVYTSAKIFGERLGVWSFIKEQTVIGKAFNFNSVDFTKFTFSIDESERLLHSKLRVKKVDKARFRIENGELNEPFGIFDLALEYVESGNYKR